MPAADFIEVQGEDEMPISLSREHAGEYGLVESRVWCGEAIASDRGGGECPSRSKIWLAFFAQAWLERASSEKRTPGFDRDGRSDRITRVRVGC